MNYILLAAGGIFCLIVLIQLAISLYESIILLQNNRKQKKLSIKLLKNQIDATRELAVERKAFNESSWNGLRKFVVKKLEEESAGVTSVYLYPHDNKKLPNFKPGQYLTLNLKLGGTEKALVRCYSLSEAYRKDYYRISVKKVLPPRDKPELKPGLASSYINDELKEGDFIDIKAPSGDFYLEPNNNLPVVLIGGGIGVTPVFSMLRTIVEQLSDQEVWFFYGLRNSSEYVYRKDLEEIAKKHANVRLIVCFSNPLDGDEHKKDYHAKERVSVDLFKRVLPSNNYSFYICGPPPMMESVVKDLQDWGVSKKMIHFEAFGPATVKKVNKPKAKKAEGAPSVTVDFSQSGKKVDWQEDATTILELAESNDVSISSGCRVGNCGTCLVAVKSGSVEYINDPTFDVEDGSCLTCIASPKENLEIDA